MHIKGPEWMVAPLRVLLSQFPNVTTVAVSPLRAYSTATLHHEELPPTRPFIKKQARMADSADCPHASLNCTLYGGG